MGRHVRELWASHSNHPKDQERKRVHGIARVLENVLPLSAQTKFVLVHVVDDDVSNSVFGTEGWERLT